MSETRLAFSGSGEQIYVEVPPIDLTPTPPLTADQRAQIHALIAAEHRGDEPEVMALHRVIGRTEYDMRRFRGERTSDGTSLSDLAERRLIKLRRYLREIEGDE